MLRFEILGMFAELLIFASILLVYGHKKRSEQLMLGPPKADDSPTSWISVSTSEGIGAE